MEGSLMQSKKTVVSWAELPGVTWFTCQNPGIRRNPNNCTNSILSIKHLLLSSLHLHFCSVIFEGGYRYQYFKCPLEWEYPLILFYLLKASNISCFFLSFLGLRGKMTLLVLKNFLCFLDFYVHTNPYFLPIAGVPNSLTAFCFKAGQTRQPFDFKWWNGLLMKLSKY